MYPVEAPQHQPSGGRAWSAQFASYRESSNRRAAFELAVTVLPLALLWLGMWGLTHVSYWLPLLLTPFAAALLVRLFMIQHDCGHTSFFRQRWLNDWTGRLLGIFTLTPYDFWRHSHALHHAGSGNLDRRGIGDIDTLTLEEYVSRSPLGRLRYRIYRHPLVMFGVGPVYLFLLQHRLPVGAMRKGRMAWLSTGLTNLGIVAISAALIYATGWSVFAVVHLPIVALGAAIGVWLFYVQHQFEETYWEKGADWSHPNAALHGSSFYDLPRPLMWVTGNIGVHHLHHLSSRIPFYRLTEVLSDFPELRKIGRITLGESFRCIRLTLWDGDRKRMVSFREARDLSAGAAQQRNKGS